MIKHFQAVLILIAISIETGCYPVKEYHRNDPVSLLSPKNISLAYIEFDDNGELFDRNELDQAIKRISDLEKNTPSGVNVVVFIHGWKNNADNNTGNVAGFRDLLNDIYDSYSQSSPSATPLVGVYIGWRGASLKVGQDLTYFNRSNATLRVAGPHLEEALFRITLAVKPAPFMRRSELTASAQQAAVEGRLSHLILIGHSFGGRVMEKAMTPYFEGLILAANKGRIEGCVDPKSTKTHLSSADLPDLTVLLNEAAPATDAKQFLELLKCHNVDYQRRDPGYGGKEADIPLFLSITSDGDSATQIALPLGQTVARLELKTRDYGKDADPPEISNQSTYYTHSTANIPALASHLLQKTSCPANEPEVHLATNNPVVHIGPKNIQQQYHLCEVPVAKTPGVPYWNHTPYWAFHIPVEIVPDHSTIFRRELYEFLEFFLPSKASLRNPKNPAVQP